jgi:LEA14-like dessication related protein
MTLYNPNRFVTGLTDISYVKQVDLVKVKVGAGQVVTIPEVQPPSLTIIPQPKTLDTFVPDTFTPENLPDNIPDDSNDGAD